MTTESRELFLSIINDGEKYAGCCQLVNQHDQTLTRGFCATAWVRLVREAATKYTQDYETVFTSRDILATALELAEHYHERAEEELNQNLDIKFIPFDYRRAKTRG